MPILCLTSGRVRPKRGERGVGRYLGGDWSEEALPVHAFLVRHPGGTCLFDTGQTALAAERRYFPRWQPFFRLARFELEPADEVPAQLARLGVDPGDVPIVVLSHLHTDHVGCLGAFRRAQVLVSAEEWRRAQGPAGRVRGYLPQRWPEGVDPTLVRFGHGAVGPFADSFDLGGDGTLVLVPLPGHTPGHMAMLAPDGGGRALLAGDAAHTRAGFAASAPEVSAWCEAEGVRVLLAHDPDAAAG